MAKLDGPFRASQFVPMEKTTAEEKAKFANKFVSFVANGMKREDFTQAFYKRLSMCFGHIAHYNIDGFYTEWFSDNNKKYGFLLHALSCYPVGDPKFCFSDVENELQNWLRDSGSGWVLIYSQNKDD